MIQDIEPHCFRNEYCPQKPERNSYLLCFSKREVLVGRNERDELVFPTFKDMEIYDDGIYEDAIYLFSIDKDRYYLGCNISCPKLSRFAMENLETFRVALPKHLAYAGITGAQLYRWYENHRFCGRCGNPMSLGEKERMLFCSECGNIEYPKIMPAVIVGIVNENCLLLSQYANRDHKRYALIAGFSEIGETIEQTIQREVMEEVGLRVKNIRYYKSQPWSFSDSLLMGFYADLDGSEEITLDHKELAMAQWFDRSEIPVSEITGSLTNEMILSFKNGLCGTEV